MGPAIPARTIQASKAITCQYHASFQTRTSAAFSENLQLFFPQASYVNSSSPLKDSLATRTGSTGFSCDVDAGVSQTCKDWILDQGILTSAD
jgi:hypothetical protein